MNKIISLSFEAILLIALFVFGSCEGPNTNADPNFDEEGKLVTLPNKTFKMEEPSRIKFYVEVSGSMNGFFRNGKPSDFKIDLWDIVSYYAPIAPDVTILTNTGSEGDVYSQSEFQRRMNQGQFVSSASTRIPDMLQTIIGNLDTDNNELAVLISDMIYDPVGQAAKEVLLGQYTVNIRNILAHTNKAVSLICATSSFFDKKGNVVSQRCPYYYFIIGNDSQVAKMRNGISTFLESRGHFVDNIDNGFDYGSPKYSFTYYENCDMMDPSQPTFVAYDDESGPAKIKMKVALEDYRWRIADERFFRNAFKIKAKYGSTVSVGEIKIKADNINDREINRKASATVELLVSNMPLDSEVLEWTLELPNTEYTLFDEFFGNAWDPNDPTHSFSVANFVEGMFYGTKNTKDLETNYILISKVNP